MANTNNNVCSKDGRMLFGVSATQHLQCECVCSHEVSHDLRNFLEMTEMYLNESDGDK